VRDYNLDVVMHHRTRETHPRHEAATHGPVPTHLTDHQLLPAALLAPTWCSHRSPVVLLPAPNLIGLRLPGEQARRHTHEQIVAFLKKKRDLHRKSPGGELAVPVDLVRYCHLDRRTDRWFLGTFRRKTTVDGVFEGFRAWAARYATRAPTRDDLIVTARPEAVSTTG
jgi:hypothetical protein